MKLDGGDGHITCICVLYNKQMTAKSLDFANRPLGFKSHFRHLTDVLPWVNYNNLLVPQFASL